MPNNATLLALLPALLISVFAVILQRRTTHRWLSSWLVAVSWSASNLLAYRFVVAPLPPVPWTAQALDAEPWESVVYVLSALCVIWSGMRWLTQTLPNVRWLSSMALTSVAIAAVLNMASRYAELHVGNTPWALFTLCAVMANWQSLSKLEDTGAGRWSLWVAVAQAMVTAALIMTCYGSFGQWALLCALALAVVALARVAVSDNDAHWSGAVSLAACAFSGILLMHVRDYSSVALPVWLAPLPYLLPTYVALIDANWGVKRHPLLRVAIAGGASAAIAAATIALVLQGSADQNW